MTNEAILHPVDSHGF